LISVDSRSTRSLATGSLCDLKETWSFLMSLLRSEAFNCNICEIGRVGSRAGGGRGNDWISNLATLIRGRDRRVHAD